MGHAIKKSCIGALSALVLGLGISGCGASSEPEVLTDDQHQAIAELVQERGTEFADPACQIEVFRTDEAATYGWATCMDIQKADAAPSAQAAEFPFKIIGGTVQQPAGGKQYQADVRSLFPEELWSAIEQHQRGA